MENKVILVTGATDGIGKETAKVLAQQGHTIIIHGRNETKLNAVADEIRAVTGNKNTGTIKADLLSLAETRKMASEFKSRYGKLDVLVNNAGAVMNRQRETTGEGLEKTMALNLFVPFLLMQSFTEVLAKSPAARIVNVSSEAHRSGGKPDFNDFQLEKSYSQIRAYGLSKLYLIWITRQMASRLKEKGIRNITANSLHPGVIASRFGLDADKGFIIDFLFKLARPFLKNVEDGAKTSIYAAVSPEVENVTGEYFNKQKIAKADDRYYSPGNEKIVWDYCEKITAKYL